MWKGGGQPKSHSTLVVAKSTARTSRLAVNASQIINRNMMTAIRDTKDPIEEIVFHSVYASG